MFENILNAIAGFLGIEPEYLAILLGIIVAIANIIGKSIPESATGWIGTLRKICKVVGLYVPQRLTPRVSADTVTKAVAASASDASIIRTADNLSASVDAGVSSGGLAREIVDAAEGRSPGRAYGPGAPEPGSTVPEEFRTDPGANRFRSPLLVGLVAIILTMLTACSTTQQQRALSTAERICASVPLAQAMYNLAVETRNESRINWVLNTIRITCPGVLALIQTYQPPAPEPIVIPPAPAAPAPTPERG